VITHYYIYQSLVGIVSQQFLLLNTSLYIIERRNSRRVWKRQLLIFLKEQHKPGTSGVTKYAQVGWTRHTMGHYLHYANINVITYITQIWRHYLNYENVDVITYFMQILTSSLTLCTFWRHHLHYAHFDVITYIMQMSTSNDEKMTRRSRAQSHTTLRMASTNSFASK